MQTLTYGLKNPENGDRGSVWFTALNDDIVQLDAHTHDGVSSALIPAKNISKGSVVTSTWTSNGTGSFRQDLTVPTGYNMDDYSMTVRITGSDIIMATIERLTSTTFRIYTLDNALAYTVIFR